MSKSLYLNLINFLGAISALLGKPTSFLDCNYYFTKITLVAGIIIDAIIIYLYYVDAISSNSGLIWVFLASSTFMVYRISAEATYHIYRSRIKTGDNNKEEIGSIISYSIIAGIALGNVGSECLLLAIRFIKGDLG